MAMNLQMENDETISTATEQETKLKEEVIKLQAEYDLISSANEEKIKDAEKNLQSS